MKMNDFVYGTQYYRAPTPLPKEWEKDISNFEAIGLNMFQVRVQWRWNEPTEGNYRFDDIDELFELAQKYGQKIIFKFMLETAPQYIFDKYDGARKGLNGTPLNPSANGAYYVGGWWPCFENPLVRQAATKFIEVFVNRYKDRPELVLWHAWNEPRCRPQCDCVCEHSLKEYRTWMQKEYKTIDNFNELYGVREESFEKIPLPGSNMGYWDFFPLIKWRATAALQDRIKWVSDTIKNIDLTRPVMAHVGCPSVIQNSYDDLSDDFSVSKSVDFYGTSFPGDFPILDHKDEVLINLATDYIRHIDKDFFVHELYPDWGYWQKRFPVEDLRYRFWTIISRASKGVVYWQYRAERLGHEFNLAGLVNMNGSNKPQTDEAAVFGKFINENMDLLNNLSVEPADVAILYDLDSDLISRIEDGVPISFDFSISPDALFNYHHTQFGVYNLFYDMSVPIDFIDSREMEDISKYKVIYVTYMNMVSSYASKKLEEFVKNGGILLADEGFGLRQQNTWLSIEDGDNNLENIVSTEWSDRYHASSEDKVILPTGDVSALPYKTLYKGKNANVLANFSDGQPSILEHNVGKGKVILFGTSIGYSYFTHQEKAWSNWMNEYLNNANIKRNPCDDVEKGIYSRTVLSGKDKYMIIFNRSKMGKTVKVDINNNSVDLLGMSFVDYDMGEVNIPAGQVSFIKL